MFSDLENKESRGKSQPPQRSRSPSGRGPGNIHTKRYSKETRRVYTDYQDFYGEDIISIAEELEKQCAGMLMYGRDVRGHTVVCSEVSELVARLMYSGHAKAQKEQARTARYVGMFCPQVGVQDIILLGAWCAIIFLP